ncbi:MAG: amino acid ABC transporter substrate-binding protein [Corynebacterium sp.]|nr:amino acid ABC transporter substrate-binding protein [Corynebacterium sp.]
MIVKKIVAAASTLLVAATLAGCSSSESTTATTAAASDTTFTVGFDPEFPPYGYKEGDEYVGFDLDLAQEVADRNGWELVKQPIAWDSKDMELNSGTIDAIWNGFTMNGREDAYTWSAPYVDNSIVVVTKQDSGIAALADLAGKNVLVQADSSGLAAIEEPENADLKASFANLTEVPDYNTAFMDVEAGAADAIIVDQGVAKYQLEQRANDMFTVVTEPLRTEQYGIGFKLGNTELRDTVQASLDEMIADGTFLTIAEKYDLQDAVVTDAAAVK